MLVEDAYRINRNTMVRWGIHRPGQKSFVGMSTRAMNVIQFAAGMHRFGYLPTQERLDAAHAELRLLEKMNENPH